MRVSVKVVKRLAIQQPAIPLTDDKRLVWTIRSPVPRQCRVRAKKSLTFAPLLTILGHSKP